MQQDVPILKGEDATIIITCSDPRVIFWLVMNKPLHMLKILFKIKKSFSAIFNTGGIKFYLKNGTNLLWEQLDILTGHFAPKKVILINHTGCGYYKNLNQDEERYYIEDLEKVAEEIKNRYNIKVEKYLLETNIGKLKKVEDRELAGAL